MGMVAVPVTNLILFSIFLLFLAGYTISALRKRREMKIYHPDMMFKVKGLGATKKLEIIPIVDWYSEHGEMKAEEGVSYLIRTDNNTVLFDVGVDFSKGTPTPLTIQMEKMGITWDDFDTVVISHNHPDQWRKHHNYNLNEKQVELGEESFYVNDNPQYPVLEPMWNDNPIAIGKGITTTGTIPNRDFMMGWTAEQAIVVNVEGKGLVVISGCGHQTLQRILDRVGMMFDEPMYGIVCGYHYPVTDSRLRMLGVEMQKHMPGHDHPLISISDADVEENIGFLREKDLKLVAMSPHDCCDNAIDEAFRNTFHETYRKVTVGEKIIC
ncbi:MAG: MBL fold metallo-hydrolase [Nitrospinota bacterium]|nr:MBL fold metallo-hydrolase [Nitrospinota bacterium]